MATSRTPRKRPPPVLDGAWVIAYAILDGTVQWTGKQTLFVGEKELGPVPRLALCKNLSGGLTDVLVFHCNEQWEVLGVSGGATLEAAKASAERAYRGITSKWVATGVGEDEAREWMRTNHAGHLCSFCERGPGDYEQLIGNKSDTVRICNHCLAEYSALIQRP
jgi:hypothetical protein